jgi:hypothetical protein
MPKVRGLASLDIVTSIISLVKVSIDSKCIDNVCHDMISITRELNRDNIDVPLKGETCE